jgi:CDP-diacylglycerol--glycerol-3-phosphate 3-phosphatidyltransferase
MARSIPDILTILRLLAAAALPVVFLVLARPSADWLALALFIAAAATDWIDGFLARRWKQESAFGSMLDPIADKAMVVIALMLVTGYSGMNPWLVLPATLILVREIAVAGLREYLGARAGLLRVTPLARRKTAAQMLAIAVLFLAGGLGYLEAGQPPRAGEGALPAGLSAAAIATLLGLLLIWAAAALTLVTGWDYFRKAMPHLAGGGR